MDRFKEHSMLQRVVIVAVCYSMWQCVAVCCNCLPDVSSIRPQ